MSFKLEFKKEGFKSQSDLFIKKVTQALQSNQLGAKISQTFITDLKFQVRRGFSLATNSRFKDLNASWVKLRRRIISQNETPSFVSPKKSNLSLSGKFLDSLTGVKQNISKGLEIDFVFRGSHEPYKVKSLKTWKVRNAWGSGKTLNFKRRKPIGATLRVGRRISNEQLYTYLTRERPFIGIRKQTQTRLRQLVIEEVRRITSQG